MFDTKISMIWYYLQSGTFEYKNVCIGNQFVPKEGPLIFFNGEKPENYEVKDTHIGITMQVRGHSLYVNHKICAFLL